ncbi:hypothetical protein QAD02_000157 [Eretmocerus hayati]|uniref:Uncharacterized protein n=2 Tax=Eretmocerus hayati TaxID=131215 RepID=A0ACC2NDB0_9HYME|nr:hypothetical protein QAD02_000155 [Eretmocerus hayati]KAJ8668898.1 hypothetical protein QAD02_000157 [Eretmocerus hayati]
MDFRYELECRLLWDRLKEDESTRLAISHLTTNNSDTYQRIWACMRDVELPNGESSTVLLWCFVEENRVRGFVREITEIENFMGLLRNDLYKCWLPGKVRILYFQKDERMPLDQVRRHIAARTIFVIPFEPVSHVWDSVFEESFQRFQHMTRECLEKRRRTSLRHGYYRAIWRIASRQGPFRSSAQEFYNAIDRQRMIDIRAGRILLH